MYGEHAPVRSVRSPARRFCRQHADARCIRATAAPCVVGTPDMPQPFDAIIGMPAFVERRAAPAPRARSVDGHRHDLRATRHRRLGAVRGRSRATPTTRCRSAAAARSSSAAPSSRSRTGGSRSTRASSFDPDPTIPQSQRGTDMLFVASTAIGVSILGLSAYQRYQLTHPIGARCRHAARVVGELLENETISGNLTTLPTHGAGRQLADQPARAVPPGLREPPAGRRQLRDRRRLPVHPGSRSRQRPVLRGARPRSSSRRRPAFPC